MRQTSALHNTNETAEEALLGATLHDHAPAIVDIDRRWTAVAERLSSRNQYTHGVKSSRFQLLHNGQHNSRQWRIIGLAAIAVFSTLLMGAGIVGYYFWGGPFGDPGIKQIGDQHLYQDIQQQQQSNQVTITVTKAYADTGRTLIAYDLQLPASVAQHYNNIVIGSFSVKDQQGEELTATNTQCTGLIHDGSPMHCLITLLPFHPKASVTQLTVTVDIMNVYLIQANNPGTEIRTGAWHFRFVLVFHRYNLGTSGPDAQPTHIP